MLDLLAAHDDDDAATRRGDPAMSRAPAGSGRALPKRDAALLTPTEAMPAGQGRPLLGDTRLSHERTRYRPVNSAEGQAAIAKHRPQVVRVAIPIALTVLIVVLGFSVYRWFSAADPHVTTQEGSQTIQEITRATPEGSVTQAPVADQARPPERIPDTPRQAPTQAQAQAPEDDGWSGEDRQNARVALRLLRLTTTAVTEEPFNAAEKTALARLRAMTSTDPLGSAAGDDLRDPRKLGLRLRTLLTRGPASPRGVPDSDATTPEARYARAWDAENGPDHDVSEAIYWYGLAARVGHLGAWTQLGLLLVRNHNDGAAAARDAALLWWVGSQNGAAVAAYNLGALYDRSADVPRDRNLAVHWYNVAVSQGNEPAVEALRRLAP